MDAPVTARLEIANRRGLHARPAAKFVRVAEQFEAEVTVSKGGTAVTGTSIMGLLLLAAANGSEIEISATGPDAQNAIEAIVALIEANFHED